jgi:uncharacterized heparinase superfamily protein
MFIFNLSPVFNFHSHCPQQNWKARLSAYDELKKIASAKEEGYENILNEYGEWQLVSL